MDATLEGNCSNLYAGGTYTHTHQTHGEQTQFFFQKQNLLTEVVNCQVIVSCRFIIVISGCSRSSVHACTPDDASGLMGLLDVINHIAT